MTRSPSTGITVATFTRTSAEKVNIMKQFTFGVEWKEYGNITIDVPDYCNTVNDAIDYVNENWSDIPLPSKHFYLDESDVPDFECAELN